MRIADRTTPWTRDRSGRRRRGVATLDYILVLGVILPLATIVLPGGMRIIRAVSEMITVFIAWPFM